MDSDELEKAQKLAQQRAIIRYLESSDGKNMNHEQLRSGPNKGQTAGGAYGIVPNSLKDFARQSMKRNIPVDTDILAYMDDPHEEVTKRLNEDREFDEKSAEMALNLINSKTGGDEAKTAYAWRTGHNRSDADMEANAAKHPYVQAYLREKEKRSPRPERVAQDEEPRESGIDLVRKLLGL